MTGEVVPAPGKAGAYTSGCGSRIPTNGWIVLTPPGAERLEPGHHSGRSLFDPVIHELLLHTDPLSLANHDYITEVEQYRSPLDERACGADLCELHQQGEIVEAIGRCIANCGATDKALAYILWGDLLQKASELAGRTPPCWRTQSTNTQRRSTSPTRPGSPTPTGVKRWTSWAVSRKCATKYAEAVAKHDDDYLAHYDLAEHLMDRLPAEAGADPNLRLAIDHYERSAELQPGNDWTLTRWGQALLRRGDHAGAAAKFRDAIRISGGNAAARQGLCEAEVPEPAARASYPSCQRAAAILAAQTQLATAPTASNAQPCATATMSTASP